MPYASLREPRREAMQDASALSRNADGFRQRLLTPVSMGMAFAVALALAVGILAVFGGGEHGTDLALQATGRFSFLLFWPAYTGGPIAAVCGPAVDVLKRFQRDFGLAFASAHLVHLGLVAWLCVIGAAPGLSSFVVFGIAVLWTYLLAALSTGQLRRAMSRQAWRLTSAIGLNYIAFAFALDLVRFPIGLDVRYLLGYLPFTVLAIAGPAFRLCAMARSLFRERGTQ